MALRRARPAPPPPEAVMLDKTQVAGYLGVRVRRIDELRRADPSFPAPRLLGPGTARWRRADLDRWIAGLRSGWCTTGGRREGAFLRKARPGEHALTVEVIRD
jgi:predicted DNA-binding transcriptional regulator AlpA